MPVDVVIIQSIPRGSILVLSGVADGDQEALTADIRRAAGHDEVAVVYTGASAKKPAQLFTTDELGAVLQASMGDEVRKDLLAAARKEAVNMVASRITPDAPPPT